MALDRGVLARVDRRLLAGLRGDETFRMVRVPTTPAEWSMWRRYCDSAGISMGRAIATLIGHELAGLLDSTDHEDTFVMSDWAGKELAKREAEVTRREQELQVAETRLRGWEVELHRREGDLEARERRASSPAKSPILPGGSWGRVGRNEPCPCGSGRKYKRCHGAATHRRRDGPGSGFTG